MKFETIAREPRRGFMNPVLGPQRTFRSILEAMAHPGGLVEIKSKLCIPQRLNPASAAVCLTLLEYETPLWTDLSWNASVIEWFQFQCGCSVVTEPCMADYALITKPETMPSLEDFKIGDSEHPGSSATLIVQVEQFNDPNGKILSGAEIRTPIHFAPAGIRSEFWEQWQVLADLFPMGVDVFFTHSNMLAALTKKTQVSDPECSGSIFFGFQGKECRR